MIYLDNAATTLQKPSEVAEAVKESFSYIGNAGRGANEASLFTSRLIFQTRKKVAELFHMTDGTENTAAERVVFTMNSTEALNIVIKGLINPGDHVITTEMEHNSVLRPLYELEKQGVRLTILPCEKDGRVSCEAMEAAIAEDTKAIVCTHGSNVTGAVNDIAKIGALCHEKGLYFILDASQTAGVFDIDLEKNHISALCFTGHKSLFGPQGTGGIALADGVRVRPLLSGGSGIHSFEQTHPKELPTALEAGTLNGHGIAGLHAALSWIEKTGMDAIHQKEVDLARHFLARIQNIPGILIYGRNEGPLCDMQAGEEGQSQKRTEFGAPIVACNIADLPSGYVSDCLAEEYGIATRAGAHCAPLIHTHYKTIEQGMVRFSFSYFNTEEEVEKAADALERIAAENRGAVTAYVGAGGKTGSIRKRTEEFVTQEKKELILTTTKMMIPKKKEVFASWKDTETEFFDCVEKILSEYFYCIAGVPLPGTEKFGMLPEKIMERLLYMADEILIEADGSAHFPVKAPAEREPVLYPFMDEVVIVMGAHAIGHPLQEVCHRLEYAKGILHCEADKIVTETDLEILMEEGYAKPIRKKFPGMKIVKKINEEGKYYEDRNY